MALIKLLFIISINDTSIDVESMSVRQVFTKLYQFENYPHFNTERMRQSSMVVSVILSFGWGALKINSLTLILDFNQLLLFTQLRYYHHFFARGRQLKYLSIDLSNIKH